MNNNTTYTAWELSEATRLYGVINDIRLSYIWFVFVLGFPTNLLSIATVLTMRTLTPATFYVATLALCDGLTLVFKLVGHQMITHGAYFGTAGCKMEFLSEYLSALANWILVFICAERFVSVCLPLKKHIIFTKRRAYISTIILTSLLLVIFVVIFALMRDSTPDGLYCGTLDEYLNFWINGWFYMSACLHLFFPLPVIVVLTLLIILGISRSRKDRRSILHNGNGYDDSNSRLLKETERLERNITIMLVVAATVFMVLSLPACIYALSYERSENILVTARQKMFEQIGFVLVDSSHAINFFLYFFSSKKFRDQFFFLVTCKRWPKHLRKSAGNGCSSMTFTTKYTVAKSTDDVSHI